MSICARGGFVYNKSGELDRPGHAGRRAGRFRRGLYYRHNTYRRATMRWLLGARKAMAKVGIIVGSDSDLDVMNESCKALEELGIEYELRIASAHRTPGLVEKYAKGAKKRGVEVIIAGAGWAAALPGVVAAYTTLPVIGVPVDSSPLNGIDSLLSIVQMPPGIPVATVAIGKGGARNAAVYAASILSLKYPDIAGRLTDFRKRLAKKVEKAAKKHNR